jgi:hypothetical protein
MATQTSLDGHPASTMTNTTVDVAPPALDEFNAHAKNGWTFFTKFLLWNVITVIIALFIVGLLTVWR